VTEQICLDWICRQPTPYNDVLFSALAADPEIDLTVHFMEAILPSHPWKTPLATGYRQRIYRRSFGVDLELLRRAQPNQFLVIGGWHELTSQLAVFWRSLRDRPFALWTDAPRVGQRSAIKELFRNSFLNVAFSGASSVMGTGKLALDRLGAMGCPPDKLVNLPYFIDLERFSPATTAVPERPLTFVSSGRLLNSLKGHDLAIAAISIVQKNHPHIPIKYRIAGTGPDRDVLLRLAHAHAVDVELLDWVEPDELVKFYQSGHVLLHPSRHDPYATAVLEAMACGIAVIGSTETGAIIDRIEHGLSGLIHESGSVEDLARQVETVCSQPARMRQMGQAARKVAESWPVSKGVATVKRVARSALAPTVS